MSFLDRAKAAAEQVRARAQEGVEEVQLKKELAQAYRDLGQKAHELASAGSISHPELAPLVGRISELLAREGSGAAGGFGAAEPTVAPEQAADTTPPETPA
jgi:hypothetical protein